MAEPAPSPQAATTAPSVDHVRGLVNVLLRYVGARGKLFQIEFQEAGSKLVGILIAIVVGLGALAGAWLLLMPAAVWFIADWLHKPWAYVAAAAGGLHLLVALAALLWVRARLGGLKLFEESLNQFERDRSWVTSNETQPK